METARKRQPVEKPAAVKPPIAAVEEETEQKKPLRPNQCRKHLRKTVAAAYRDIVDGFVKQAKSGSCQHLKMATEMVEPVKRAAKEQRATGPVARFLEEMVLE